VSKKDKGPSAWRDVPGRFHVLVTSLVSKTPDSGRDMSLAHHMFLVLRVLSPQITGRLVSDLLKSLESLCTTKHAQ